MSIIPASPPFLVYSAWQRMFSSLLSASSTLRSLPPEDDQDLRPPPAFPAPFIYGLVTAMAISSLQADGTPTHFLAASYSMLASKIFMVQGRFSVRHSALSLNHQMVYTVAFFPALTLVMLSLWRGWSSTA
ncbi:hypothetical protein BD779DRAFT_1671517 [Infundibulicybe gibba]|nr:hypothetical protein BD779DRAFT_1671517 [Infundibulicybe gibba]